MGYQKDSSTGRKKSWRQWQWHKIVIALKKVKQIKKAIVLYIVGPYDPDKPKEFDPDRKLALKYGFRNDNLIAVNWNIDTIKEVRKRGGLGYHGNFYDIIQGWKGEPLIDVIIADLCCGYTINTMTLIYQLILNSSLSTNSIIAINLFRGRDKLAVHFNNLLQKNGCDITKNRAQIFYENHLSHMTAIALYHNKSKSLEECLKRMEIDNSMKGMEQKQEMINKIIDISKPQFRSYKASKSNTFMDSVVYMMPIKGNYDQCKPNRQIAAIKAHRTMRMENH